MATKKQKKAIAILAENVGMPVGEAMRQAGYSEVTSLTPQRLTESAAYKTIAEQIPDDLLVKVHTEGLNAKQFRFSPEGELIKLDDFATRHKYLESAYKLKKVIEGDGPKLALLIQFDPIFNASSPPETEGNSQ